MIKIRYVTIHFIMIFFPAILWAEEIHQDWILADSIFISKLKKQFIIDKMSLIGLLKPNLKEKEDIGFGYQYLDGSIGKGYVSTFYGIVYRDNIPISYALHQQEPFHDEIKIKYENFYKGFFNKSKDGSWELFINFDSVAYPILGKFLNDSISEDIKLLFSPFSGIVYGNRGGIANSYLRNRKIYIKNKLSFRNDDYFQMLYCLNPASRLIAVEYFWTEGSSKIKTDTAIGKRINIVLENPNEIETMSGCNMFKMNSKKAVRKTIEKIKNER